MTKKILYWVDDETRFYPILTMLRPEDVELAAYAGKDAADDFLRAIDNGTIINSPSNFFLIDLFMPVPRTLEKNHSIWKNELSEYGKNRMEMETVCGIAVALHIHQKLRISKENIRILTGYASARDINIHDFEILYKANLNLPKEIKQLTNNGN